MDFTKEMIDMAQMEAQQLVIILNEKGIEVAEATLIAMFFSAIIIANIAISQKVDISDAFTQWVYGLAFTVSKIPNAKQIKF